MTEQKQAKRFYISGRVQGVGYRFFAQRVADRLGLSGYVKNLPDERVEVYAVGDPTQLLVLREELRRGPAHSSVDEVDEMDAELNADLLASLEPGFSIEVD